MDTKNKNQLFLLLSAAVALATLWNIRENHKVRKLQKKELEDKISSKSKAGEF
tara:strand:+ start:843 stop:1001 length:159 start_codon:yes stop_codon:yes gene_type:complete